MKENQLLLKANVKPLILWTLFLDYPVRKVSIGQSNVLSVVLYSSDEILLICIYNNPLFIRDFTILLFNAYLLSCKHHSLTVHIAISFEISQMNCICILSNMYFIFFHLDFLFLNFSLRYVASLEALKPLSDLLSVDDPKIIIVSLTAIDNILRIGEQIVKEAQNSIVNPYALQIEECFGEYIVTDAR